MERLLHLPVQYMIKYLRYTRQDTPQAVCQILLTYTQKLSDQQEMTADNHKNDERHNLEVIIILHPSAPPVLLSPV